MKISSDSSSTYTDASYSNLGFSGLASGIDTESMVKSMLSGLQTKIDKQNQQKQQLLWKQEMYRDVISKINSFQSKYLDLTSNTSLRTNGFFNQMTTESSSSAVKILSSSSASQGDMSVQVAQLATASKVTSGKFSSGSIDIDLNSITDNLDEYFSTAEQNITFTIGSGETAQTLSVNLCAAENLDGEGNPSVEKMVENINSQLSQASMDIKLTIGDENKITVESTSDEPQEFTLSGSSNALSTLGLKAYTFNDDNEYKLESTAAADASRLLNTPPEKAQFTMSLDGVSKTITIENGDADSVLESFKSQVKKAFGSSVTFTDNGDGTASLTARAGQTLSVSGDNSSVVGIEPGSCTRLTTGTKLSDLGMSDYSFTVNGKSFDFTGDTTVSDVIKAVNSSDAGVTMIYNTLSDSFSMTANSTGEGFDIEMSGAVADKFFANSTFTAGQNAVVNVDGTTIERTSNTFTINGMTMELKATTGNYFDENGQLITAADGKLADADGKTDDAAQVSAVRNTDEIVKTIKSFVEDYNSLIKNLNELTHASKTYREYAPLTDAQKDEMKDSEITAWEKKAHEGLLSGDSDISSFLQSMRKTMYSKADSGFSLAMFGIDSSSDWKDYGKLEIDEKALTEALEANADDVISTFTSVANNLNTACKNAANTSLASPGRLVTIAGVEGKVSDKNNNIQSQLDAIAEKLERLQEQYDQQKDRYWKQFNSMETALSNMNSTSTYLAQMLGG